MNISSSPSTPAHGGQLRQIAARYGVPAENLLDLSANINPAGPPKSVLDAIQHALSDPATLITYPDLELTELKRTIADCAQVHPKNIAVANGFVPLLDAALRSSGIRRCLLPVPCFNEYRKTLENAGVEVIPYLLTSKAGFAYEADAISKALDQHSCDAILLANPQNPSGVVCEAKEMMRLIKGAAGRNVRVFLDEAFIDYSPNESVTQQAIEQLNIIVFRSVTKFFAMPGLRVAYAVSNSSTIENLNQWIAPWPVTSLASEAVCAALRDDDYANQSRLLNESRRTSLERELARLNVSVYRSSANFLLLRFSSAVDVSSLWLKLLVEQQIVLRPCTNFEDLETEHLRVAVRSEEENARLITGLEAVLRSQSSAQSST